MELGVDVSTVRIFSAQSQSSVPGNNKVEEEELQSDRSLRERYSSDLVDDLDGTDASSDRDEEDLSLSLPLQVHRVGGKMLPGPQGLAFWLSSGVLRELLYLSSLILPARARYVSPICHNGIGDWL